MTWKARADALQNPDDPSETSNLNRLYRLSYLEPNEAFFRLDSVKNDAAESSMDWLRREPARGTILPFVHKKSVFERDDIAAMSTAFDDVCNVLKLRDGTDVREIIAERIIDLARRGERSLKRLRDRVLGEAGLAEYADHPTTPRNSGGQSSETPGGN